MKTSSRRMRSAPELPPLAADPALARLAALQDWTEQHKTALVPEGPVRPEPQPEPEGVQTAAQASNDEGRVATPPKAASKPPGGSIPKWELVPADKPHPYQLPLTERQWLKIDRIVRDDDHPSVKAFLLGVIDAAIDKALKHGRQG